MLLSGDPSVPGGWVDAYCERPEAIAPFMEADGFHTLDLVGADGSIVTVSTTSGTDRDGSENGVESGRGRWAEVEPNSVP
jgi:hypothetical protein